jgi:DNA-binding NtrC family response regulator
MNKILIFEDQLYIRVLISKELVKEGYQVNAIDCVEHIWKCIKDYHPDLVLLGLYPESYDCWGILEEAKRKAPGLPMLIYAVRNFKDIGSFKQAINEVLGNKSFSFNDQSPAYRSL